MRHSLLRYALTLTLIVIISSVRSIGGHTQKDSSSVPAIGASEITVLKSDERSLLFEWRPRFTPPREIQADGQTYVRYDFSGSVPSDMRQFSGFPDLRSRHFPIALPGDKGSVARIIAADYEDIPSVTLAPIPTFRVRDSMMRTDSYAMNKAAYRTAAFLPASVVEFEPSGFSRSLALAAVRVYPVQYNPAARTVRKYRRITIEVAYGPRSTRAQANGDETPFGNVLLNSNMAPSWKATASPAVIKSSVLASGPWYRLTVSDSGIFRLSSSYLSGAGIDLASVDPRTFKIYGNNGTEIPEDPLAPRPDDLVENAIYVEGESDGKFDPGDFVLFYGRSPRGFTYDPISRTYAHYISHYTEVNYYWLTFGGTAGKRMAAQRSLSTTGGIYAPDKFLDAVAVEIESENRVQSGKDWLGQRIKPDGSFTLRNSLPGLVPNDRILYRYRLVAASTEPSTLTVVEKNGNSALGAYTLGKIQSEDIAGTAGSWRASGTSTLSEDASRLGIAFQTSDDGATAWIDWVEINYPRLFWAVGNVLHFRAPDTSAVVEYRLQQFTETPWIFNVTSHPDVRMITGMTGAYTFQAAETAQGPSEYWASGPSTWKVPAEIEHQTNQDLRGFSAGAQFIILTTHEFRTAAERLAAYRQGQGISTVVVDVAQIYNEFAGGLPDIAGIRDYLRYAYTNWTQRPRYVLFFGQASYDYKEILGSKSSYVPTWQSVESLDGIESYSTDDFFARFGPGTALSLVLGRISPRNLQEADLVVDKILRYGSSSARDAWKLRILYVGDDAVTPKRGYDDGTMHSKAIEDLAEDHTPRLFEKRKIYIAEYPTEYSPQGRRKPGAFRAIIDAINQGALLVNYAGHGKQDQLADENIFNTANSLPQLVNNERLTVFLMATCSFSQFDDPGRASGGELLMNKRDGGAVGVIAATRKVYAPQNSSLANGMYDYMFQKNSYGQIIAVRPAEALFLYKATKNEPNDQKFFYMGDPTMQLQMPSGYACIDSINGVARDTLRGSQLPTLIRALSRVVVSGSIRRQDNAIDETCHGKLTLVVNDPTRTKTIVDFCPGEDWPYMMTGATIFRGENSLTNGRFRASFVVPRDVFLGDSTAPGRMLAYFSNDFVDGAGVTESFRIGPPNAAGTNDREGPQISIYLDSRSYRSGDMVSEKPFLIVDLEDSSGINTSNSGIGHRIEAWINNSTESKDVTDAFVNKLDSYTEGSLQTQLTDLPQGRNRLRVRAWDSFNNSASAETYFEVSSSDQLTLADVFNYPNPLTSSTEFTFRQNQSGLLNITVKIYTVAGRLIQALSRTSAGESFIRVPWDGRDRDGDLVANGVYFYKILVSTMDGQFSSEALGKLAIAR